MMLKTQMERMISTSYSNIGGIVVRRDGDVIYEKYQNNCTPQSTFHIFSVTKSIVSILIGIAIDKEYIKSIDQKLLNFFPGYTIRRGEKMIQNITLKDILTMTAPYKYKTEPYEEYFTSDDWVKKSLDLLGGTGKIGEFRYAGVIGPDILSGILVNTTGQSVLEFAYNYLFQPLGITVEENIIFHDKEEQLAFYQKKDVKGWVADPKGVNTGGWGLHLTANDMAKLGQLYLDGGRYNGKQIVSEAWVRESTTKHSRCEEFSLSYGYLWWLIDEKEHAYAAMGDGGNVIYVNAKKGLVIAIASLFVPHAKDRLKLIRGYMEPVFER